MVDEILYYVGPKPGEMPTAVVPTAIHQQIMEDYHRKPCWTLLWALSLQGTSLGPVFTRYLLKMVVEKHVQR